MSDNGKKGESPTVEHAFELLDRWRHLPAYQLERRADIFFALFLPEVLGDHFKTKINPLLVPEFPIRKGLLPKYDNKDNRSVKADYLALELALEDGAFPKRAFLVELKTDSASRRDDQDENLGHAVCVGLKSLVEGVIDICCSTKQRRKYVHLVKLLSCLNLVGYDDALFPQSKDFVRLLKSLKSKVEENDCWPCLELVYVAPKQVNGATTITFKKFADAIGKSDCLRHTFACHLRKWACEDAGSPNPKDWRSC